MLREDTLDDVIQHRNKLLLNFFTANGINARLTGEDQKPYVVYNEAVLLSCYVKNFELYFVKEPNSNDIVRSFKLNNQVGNLTHELLETIGLCSHRPVYKIKLESPDNFFLVGFNFRTENHISVKYPVFAKHKPNMYFNKEYAANLVETLVEENYPVVLV
jgi:hypothetical protein